MHFEGFFFWVKIPPRGRVGSTRAVKGVQLKTFGMDAR